MRTLAIKKPSFFFYNLSTVITTSGHINAQLAQPIHMSMSVTVAGWYPFALILLLSKVIIFCGHTLTHNPHPLHSSSWKVTFPLTLGVALAIIQPPFYFI